MPKVIKSPSVNHAVVPRNSTVPKVATRQILYPRFQVRAAFGTKAVTVSQAKDLIGWQVLPERDDTCCPETSNLFGFPVRLTNDDRNRPVDPTWVKTLCQEHLNKQWRVNGETVIVGYTGRIISGQHRLLSLILAGKTWDEDQTGYWRKKWKTEPTMDTVIVLGIAEVVDTFRMLNCGKPMGFADVLYRSDTLITYKPTVRRELSRLIDYATAILWERTGASLDAHCSRRTHGEAMGFLTRHPKVVDAASHLMDENQGGKVAEVIGPGPAAGLLYLMASSTSDVSAYIESGCNESSLDFSRWDVACSFWSELATGSGPSSVVRKAIDSLFVRDDNGMMRAPSPRDRANVVVKAWGWYADGEHVKHSKMPDGRVVVTGRLTVGGIDKGPDKDIPSSEVDGE